MKDLFRQASLDKISSPEQLDKMVRLTSGRSWMGIAFFSIILTSILVWGVTGTIPQKYHGQGIIMSSGGTAIIQSATSGVLSDVTIERGDYVNFGDVIARIDQRDVVEKIEDLERELDIMKTQTRNEYSRQINDNIIEIEKQQSEIEKQQLLISDYVLAAENAKAIFMRAQDTFEKKLKLYDAGAVSEAEFLDNKAMLDYTRRDFEQAQALLSESKQTKEYLEFGVVQLEKQNKSLAEEMDSYEDVQLVEKQIQTYKQQLKQADIISYAEGKVIRIGAKRNQVIQAGQSLATILQKGININDTAVLFYLPIEQGKALSSGMKVNIYPSIYNRQEYGHMQAVVTEVSDYAVSTEDIAETLGNENLVQKFEQTGVLVEVKANLIKDEETASGFYWSSKKGRQVDVDEGIMCDISVTVEENKPISLVIPIIKSKLLP